MLAMKAALLTTTWFWVAGTGMAQRTPPLLNALSTGGGDKFYQLRADLRKCASPMCGGYFLTALNRLNTLCADGTLAEECYVAALRGDEFAGLLSDGDIVLGAYIPNAYPSFPGIADLNVTSAWTSVQDPSSNSDAECNCGDEEVCILDPNSICKGCNCPVTCKSINKIPCDGTQNQACPNGLICVVDDTCDPANAACVGMCVSPDGTICAGIAGVACTGSPYISCFDDPSDDCDPRNGGADCSGICAQEPGMPCGGIAGFPCGPGLTCFDPLNDGCDFCDGGADCFGICLPS